MTRIPVVRSLVPLALVLAGLALAAVPARAQSCGAGWQNPVVCRVDLVVTRSGESQGETLPGSTLTLPQRAEIDLHAVATDQRNQRFPADRFYFTLDVERGCSGLFDVERVDADTVRLKTGARTGECDGTFWVANNTNFDRRIRFQVERTGHRVYSRREADFIARSLYRALLGRDGEQSGVAATAEAIQRGDLTGQIHAILRSPEFARSRSKVPPQEMLRDLYQGILGRDPDSVGARNYQRRVERGEIAYVATELVTSDEFEQRLAREAR